MTSCATWISAGDPDRERHPQVRELVSRLLRRLISSLCRRAGAKVPWRRAKSVLERARGMGGIGEAALMRERGDRNLGQRSLP
jgi:hypothetical protein